MHDQIFKAFVPRIEGCLSFVSLSNLDQVIGPTKVHLSKNLGVTEFFKELVNEREEALISNSNPE